MYFSEYFIASARVFFAVYDTVYAAVLGGIDSEKLCNCGLTQVAIHQKHRLAVLCECKCDVYRACRLALIFSCTRYHKSLVLLTLSGVLDLCSYILKVSMNGKPLRLSEISRGL